MVLTTSKDGEVFDSIRDYIDKHDYPPSYREIGIMNNLKSPSSVFSHMHRLYNAGIIETDHDLSAARAFRIAKNVCKCYKCGRYFKSAIKVQKGTQACCPGCSVDKPKRI